jgi:hypothetical protein
MQIRYRRYYVNLGSLLDELALPEWRPGWRPLTLPRCSQCIFAPSEYGLVSGGLNRRVAGADPM